MSGTGKYSQLVSRNMQHAACCAAYLCCRKKSKCQVRRRIVNSVYRRMIVTNNMSVGGDPSYNWVATRFSVAQIVFFLFRCNGHMITSKNKQRGQSVMYVMCNLKSQHGPSILAMKPHDWKSSLQQEMPRAIPKNLSKTCKVQINPLPMSLLEPFSMTNYHWGTLPNHPVHNTHFARGVLGQHQQKDLQPGPVPTSRFVHNWIDYLIVIRSIHELICTVSRVHTYAYKRQWNPR